MMIVGTSPLLDKTEEAFLQMVRACGDAGVSERYLYIVPMHDLTREEFDAVMNKLVSFGNVRKAGDRFFVT